MSEHVVARKTLGSVLYWQAKRFAIRYDHVKLVHVAVKVYRGDCKISFNPQKAVARKCTALALFFLCKMLMQTAEGRDALRTIGTIKFGRDDADLLLRTLDCCITLNVQGEVTATRIGHDCEFIQVLRNKLAAVAHG